MKAIIPVAGAGTMLRPLTYTQPKPLIPVAGKPIIAYIVDNLVSAGIDDFVFVVGYLGEKIRMYIEENYPQIKKEFILQEPRYGTGHAVWVAISTLYKNEPVIIQFGDTILDVDMKAFVSSPTSVVGIKKTDNPTAFGVADINSKGFIERITEKPKIPKSNMALVGLYKIIESSELQKALNFIVTEDVRTLGELQLTDALMYLIERGIEVSAFEVNNWWDCGQKDKLLNTNAFLLEKLSPKTPEDSNINNCIIVPPVSIGKNCKLTNSIIGPFVSIGDFSIIEKSILSNSIIGSYSELKDAVLNDSILGNDTSIKGFSQSLNIGDNANIDLSQ